MNISPNQLQKRYECIVIGGGFYGCIVAEHLARSSKSVLLIEKEHDLMQRASYVNQARIHQGYHYPRSILTSLRSRVNFPRFVSDYAPCVYKEFNKYYAIGKISSKIAASQFRLFCERIGAPYKKAPANVRRLFNDNLIEDVVQVKEYAFDAVKLKQLMWDKLAGAGVSVLLDATAGRIANTADRLKLDISAQRARLTVSAHNIFNCSYSHINQIMHQSGAPIVPLKHEITEMALMEMPESLKHFSVTVMDGPFFSIMPFPSRGLHSLSHVRYTPHCFWHDSVERDYIDADSYMNETEISSKHLHMIMDAKRYIPRLQECHYVESMWEIKTILPQSETDDSRPILFKQSEEIPGLVSIMGGKIDNIYDVKNHLDEIIG